MAHWLQSQWGGEIWLHLTGMIWPWAGNLSQILTGDQVLTGDRELKVAIAGCKLRSRVISGDRELQLAIASYNWR